MGSPLLIVILIFLFVTPLTQFMSNAATIILLTPIALLVSSALNINPKAMLTAVRFAASIAIATPVAMPANSMAVEPGGYRFKDYLTRQGQRAVCLVCRREYQTAASPARFLSCKMKSTKRSTFSFRCLFWGYSSQVSRETGEPSALYSGVRHRP